MDDQIAQFTAITSAAPERAQQYLQISDGNIEQAVQLFFENDGADLGGSLPQQPSAQPTQGYTENPDGTITIDDEDEQIQQGAGGGGNTFDDDEAFARRLQEEAYGAGGGGAPVDEVRAPMARTTETLVEPDPIWRGGNTWRGDESEMRPSLAEDFMANERRRAPGPRGIFNQQQETSVWSEEDQDPESRRRNLARATGGASEVSAKSNLLAELFRPPVDLIASSSLDDAREQGKEEEKWILINIQDPSIFDCQVLNRDLWKNPSVRDTVKENFLFMQFNKDDRRSSQYTNYYFPARDSEDAYPHIAIIDPRTGEQVKVWSGSPAPKPPDFLMDLHEFLDRYSLKAFAKNPVANRKPETKGKDVDRMTEEEMLEMALQNSMDNRDAPRIKSDDPDALTRDDSGKGKAPTDVPEFTENGQSVVDESPFAQISSTSPHTEPTDPNGTTRIQFRWSGGRVVRRFALTDPVRRMYEWLKAAPLEDKEGTAFDLIFMGKNMLDSIDMSIEEAGLKNGSIMVEFLEA